MSTEPERVGMTTYRRADGELIHDEWVFSLDVEACENEADYADEPIECNEESTSDNGCIAGVWYGYCEAPGCGGFCEPTGQCGCPCHAAAGEST